MSRGSILARGRARSRRAMVDTCRVTRTTVDSTDVDTGEQDTTVTTIYEGPCRVRQREAGPRSEDAGEDYVLLRRIELQLPIAAAGIEVGDDAVMLTSRYDPDLVGRDLRVRELANGTEITARRLYCEEVTS